MSILPHPQVDFQPLAQTGPGAGNQDAHRALDVGASSSIAIHPRSKKIRNSEIPEDVARAKRSEDRRRRFAANPELRRKRDEARDRWRLNHPEEYRTYRRDAKNARRLRKRKSTVDKLWLDQKGRCVYCRNRLGETPHVDHRLARRLGGTDDISNLQLTCEPCNIAKGAMLHDDFLLWRQKGISPDFPIKLRRRT